MKVLLSGLLTMLTEINTDNAVFLVYWKAFGNGTLRGGGALYFYSSLLIIAIPS